MSDRVLCPECGMEHLSSERNCTYCGYDLADLIVDFKDKHLPVSFNNEEKKDIESKALIQDFTKLKKIPSKSRKRTFLVINFFFVLAIIISSILFGLYKDTWIDYDELTFGFLVSVLIIAFLISLIPLIRVNKIIASEGRTGCCTKGPVFSSKELEQKPMKVKKIPSLIIYNVLLILMILCLVGGFVMLIIFSNNPELKVLCIIGSITMSMSVVTTVLAVIVRTLNVTKGRSYCYSGLYPQDDYEPTKVEECLQSLEGCNCYCGIGFMIFFIDFISILFKK
ncbi:MAG: hypothetical protein ACFFDS_06110 [Candidatus Thorarchaeota archaeon]